ncbi:hypothetical protein [Rhizobium sp.]|uniref:hypothetical protein n=1 Tax=Rhizobium sp. TaxID=391 RepID=UPI003899AF24
MATVLLDVSASSKEWFKDALDEMSKAKNVKFLYTDQPKYRNEIARVFALAQFLKLMAQKGRRVDVDARECQEYIDNLERNPKWTGSGACDDPHLFAMVALKPTRYIFTDEHRISKCRGCMVATHAQMCAFKAIRTQAVYKKHRSRIFKA